MNNDFKQLSLWLSAPASYELLATDDSHLQLRARSFTERLWAFGGICFGGDRVLRNSAIAISRWLDAHRWSFELDSKPQRKLLMRTLTVMKGLPTEEFDIIDSLVLDIIKSQRVAGLILRYPPCTTRTLVCLKSLCDRCRGVATAIVRESPHVDMITDLRTDRILSIWEHYRPHPVVTLRVAPPVVFRNAITCKKATTLYQRSLLCEEFRLLEIPSLREKHTEAFQRGCQTLPLQSLALDATIIEKPYLTMLQDSFMSRMDSTPVFDAVVQLGACNASAPLAPAFAKLAQRLAEPANSESIPKVSATLWLSLWERGHFKFLNTAAYDSMVERWMCANPYDPKLLPVLNTSDLRHPPLKILPAIWDHLGKRQQRRCLVYMTPEDFHLINIKLKEAHLAYFECLTIEVADGTHFNARRQLLADLGGMWEVCTRADGWKEGVEKKWRLPAISCQTWQDFYRFVVEERRPPANATERVQALAGCLDQWMPEDLSEGKKSKRQ